MKKFSVLFLVIGGIFEVIPCMPLNIIGLVIMAVGILFANHEKKSSKTIPIVFNCLAIVVGVLVLLLAFSMKGATSTKILGFDATITGITQIIVGVLAFVSLFVLPKLANKN